jgi:tetratricopeptide (TPR) repeat protein
MPRRLPFIALAILAAAGLALPTTASPSAEGRRELDLGRAAYARKDYRAAVEHLQAAVAALDRERERAAVADAYLDLGLSTLVGTGETERALAAFQASAELAENPANALLLAAAAAERLGRADQAAALRTRALAPVATAPPAPPAAVATAPAAPVPTAQPAAKAAPAPASAAKPAAPEAKAGKQEAPGKGGSAFDYFFKKKRPQPEGAAEEPKAPAEPPPPPSH